MVNDKLFELRPVNELFSIVKDDFRTFDAEGLVEDDRLLKTVMYCNEKLGIPIREIREVAIPVIDFKASLPIDFERLYYACALQATNGITTELVNPFDNNVDQDIVYEAELDRASLGCVENYQVIVKRQTKTTIHNYGSWVQLDVSSDSKKFCHIDCPNKRRKGRYTISIKSDHIETPFKNGTLYVVYIGLMKDMDGNVTFPFHPMITPYYEWMCKEKILQDAIFNSDKPGIGELYKEAKMERAKAWLDAFNITTEKPVQEWKEHQRRKELNWYHQYFRYFK
jgi:hypothetical protein